MHGQRPPSPEQEGTRIVGGVLAAFNETLEGYNVIRTPAVLSKKVSGVSLETAASVMNPLHTVPRGYNVRLDVLLAFYRLLNFLLRDPGKAKVKGSQGMLASEKSLVNEEGCGVSGLS
jgi:hypothetical protein